MYQILQQGAGLQIYQNGEKVLGGVQPHLTREDGGAVNLKLLEIQQKDRTVVYYSDGADVSCILTFKSVDDQLCCSFSGKIAYEISYRADSFSAKNGISLYISEIPKEKNYLGFYRHNLWWTRQKHVGDLAEIPASTQSLIWKSGVSYYNLFPLAGFAPYQKADLSPADIPDFENEATYLLKCCGEESACFVTGNTRISIEMEAGKSRLYSITKMENEIAFLGLTEKYISSAAIKETIPCKKGMLFVLQESGQVGYGCKKPHEVRVNGALITPRKVKDLWILDLPKDPNPISVEIIIL